MKSEDSTITKRLGSPSTLTESCRSCGLCFFLPYNHRTRSGMRCGRNLSAWHRKDQRYIRSGNLRVVLHPTVFSTIRIPVASFPKSASALRRSENFILTVKAFRTRSHENAMRYARRGTPVQLIRYRVPRGSIHRCFQLIAMACLLYKTAVGLSDGSKATRATLDVRHTDCY
jgi:hypothetical protein